MSQARSVPLSKSDLRYLRDRLVKEVEGLTPESAEAAIEEVQAKGSRFLYEDAKRSLLPKPERTQRVRKATPPPAPAPVEEVPFQPDTLRVLMPDNTILRVARLPDDYMQRAKREWAAKIAREREVEREKIEATKAKGYALTKRLAERAKDPNAKPVML